MKCKEIMNRNVEWLLETDSVQKAATRMADVGVGFLPICDASRRAVGVVTDRDLVTRGMAQGINPDATGVTVVMTAPAVTCLIDADVAEAEDLMAKERKSRLVITNADGTFAGVLSIVDLIENAPQRAAIHTLRAVLLRDALGPRGGAAPGEPLLQDDPAAAENLPKGISPAETGGSVFQGGSWNGEANRRMFPT